MKNRLFKLYAKSLNGPTPMGAVCTEKLQGQESGVGFSNVFVHIFNTFAINMSDKTKCVNLPDNDDDVDDYDDDVDDYDGDDDDDDDDEN